MSLAGKEGESGATRIPSAAHDPVINYAGNIYYLVAAKEAQHSASLTLY